MQLRVIEIEAIKTKILNELSSKIEYPDFSAQLNDYKEALIQIENHRNRIHAIEGELQEIYNKFPQSTRYIHRNKFEDFVDTYYKAFEDKLKSEYMISKLPTALDIQNDIILSSNKDLSELVKELISKYSK